MYRKLLPHVNQFVCLRQGPFGRSYLGRLVSVDAETAEIQTYSEEGTEAELWAICINTITEMTAKSRILNTLALRVKWANSHEPAEQQPEVGHFSDLESANREESI